MNTVVIYMVFDTDAFRHLVQEIMQDFTTDMDITGNALHALQTAAEDYVLNLFTKANAVVVHSGREKLEVKDMDLVRMIQGENNRSDESISETLASRRGCSLDESDA